MHPPAIQRLAVRLERYRSNGLFRVLPDDVSTEHIDLSSNDYLGIVTDSLLAKNDTLRTGSTGSRLLTGNSPAARTLEEKLARFHQTESALLFNSGYDANVGVLSALPQRGDTILYDELCHASIRDGIRLSFAQAFSFRHNDLESLTKKLSRARGAVYVVVESVYSMDGDIAPLSEFVSLSKKEGFSLIVDEAHATGVFGERGEGIVQKEKLHGDILARIHTFGKALGCHGAVVVGNRVVIDSLINFSNSFKYTTALPATSLGHISSAYDIIPTLQDRREALSRLELDFQRIDFGNTVRSSQSDSPIQTIIVAGIASVKALAVHLQKKEFDIRPILAPTVPEGSERLRVCLHSFNTKEQIELLARTVREWSVNE